MTEIAEWNDAIDYETFLKNARENVELMKARYSDFVLNEVDEASLKGIQKKLIIKTLQELVDEKNVHLEFPLDESHGDYSSNIAMQMFAKLKNQK